MIKTARERDTITASGKKYEMYDEILKEKAYKSRDLGDARQKKEVEKSILEGVEIELDEVRPGEIITSSLINSIIKKLNALELQSIAFDDVFKFGPLAKDTHTIIVLGGGWNDKEGIEGVWVDGKQVSDLEDGINIVILDDKLDVAASETFDTLSSENIKKLLSSIKNAELIIVIIKNPDEPSENVDIKEEINAAENAKFEAAFKSIGMMNKGIGFIAVVSPKEDIEETAKGVVLSAMNFKGYPLSVWGIYSLPHNRFILGGSTGYNIQSAAIGKYVKG